MSFLEDNSDGITIQVTLSSVQLMSVCYNMSEMPPSNIVRISMQKISGYRNNSYSDGELSFAA